MTTYLHHMQLFRGWSKAAWQSRSPNDSGLVYMVRLALMQNELAKQAYRIAERKADMDYRASL